MPNTAPISEHRLQFALQLADPDLAPAVPVTVKHVIQDLVDEIARLSGVLIPGQQLVAEIKRLREETPGMTLADAKRIAEGGTP